MFTVLFRNSEARSSEGLLDADFTKRRRIEHYFYAMGTVSIVFIQVKKHYATGREKLDVIAQALAESLGMSHFPIFFSSFYCRFRFDSTANNISFRLCKLEDSTLGT